MLKKIISAFSALFVFIPTTPFAQDVISTDISAYNTTGTVIEDQVIARFNGSDAVADITALGLPSTADIAALHYVDETTVLFTLKTAAQLESLAVRANDVLEWKNGDFTKVVSGSDLGLGPATGIDALTKNGDALIFSIDTADTINGVSVSDSDLLAWSNVSPSAVLLEQSVCGIPFEADLSGVHWLDSGDYLMTFSSTTEVGGVPSRVGDIMKCNPNTKTVTLHRRFADQGDSWASVGLDAISQSSLEIIFINSFED